MVEDAIDAAGRRHSSIAGKNVVKGLIVLRMSAAPPLYSKS